MIQAYPGGRGHAKGPEVYGRGARAVCESAARVQAGLKNMASELSHERGRVDREIRTRSALSSCSLRRRTRGGVSDGTGGGENGCSRAIMRLTLRDGHVKREVNEIVGLQDGLLGR